MLCFLVGQVTNHFGMSLGELGWGIEGSQLPVVDVFHLRRTIVS